MTYFLSPIGNNSQVSTSGAPLSAGTITTYLVGTNTLAPTYTDNTGATPQPNPITLNTYGLPASPIWMSGNQALKFVINDSLGNLIRTIDGVWGIDDPFGAGATRVGNLALTTSLGAVIDRAYNEYLLNANLATVIPFDDTIPQIAEGTPILTATITPKSLTNRLRVRVQAWGSAVNATDTIVVAVFVNGATNASAASAGPASSGAGALVDCVLEYEFVPASTSAQVITVNIGGATGTIRLNGTTAARRFGGVTRTTLVVEEIAV